MLSELDQYYQQSHDSDRAESPPIISETTSSPSRSSSPCSGSRSAVARSCSPSSSACDEQSSPDSRRSVSCPRKKRQRDSSQDSPQRLACPTSRRSGTLHTYEAWTAALEYFPAEMRAYVALKPESLNDWRGCCLLCPQKPSFTRASDMKRHLQTRHVRSRLLWPCPVPHCTSMRAHTLSRKDALLRHCRGTHPKYFASRTHEEIYAESAGIRDVLAASRATESASPDPTSPS